MSTICDDLRKSILKAAMNGDLSASKEGWNESKLEELCVEITTGGAAPQGKNNFCDDGPCFVRVADMGKLGTNKKLNDTRDHLTNSGVGKLKLFPTGTVLFTKSGASLLLNQRAILEKPMYVVSHIGCAIPNDAITSDFLYLILKSIDFNEYAHATSLPSLKITDLKNVKVSYPNIEQQKQIVEKVDELMARVADLEQSADALASLKKTFPDDIKASLLQAAMQGKLTKQLPEDGNAEDLLEEIKAEKEKLITEGKIKKQKPLAPITDKEIPFEIPGNWKWTRLDDIVSILGDGIHGTPQYNDDGEYYFVNGNNLENGKIVIKNNTKRVDEVEYKKHKKELGEKTMLISINGTIGNIAFYNAEKIILGKSACYFNLIDEKFKPYFFYLFQTRYFLDYALSKATGSTIKNVSLATMKNFVIPIPPVAEQRRIVECLKRLLCDIKAVENLIASE